MRLHLTITEPAFATPINRASINFTRCKVKKLVFPTNPAITAPVMMQLRFGRSSLNQVCEPDSSRTCFFSLPILPGTPVSYISQDHKHWDFVDEFNHEQSLDMIELEVLGNWEPLTMDVPLFLELDFSM